MAVVLGIVMVWVLMAGAVGLLAGVFQRSALGWFLVSLIGSPPTGFACLLALRLTDPDGRIDITPRVAVVFILAAATLVIAVRLYKSGTLRLTAPKLQGQRALAHVVHTHPIQRFDDRGAARGMGQ
jgi:hypothetical protein